MKTRKALTVRERAIMADALLAIDDARLFNLTTDVNVANCNLWIQRAKKAGLTWESWEVLEQVDKILEAFGTYNDTVREGYNERHARGVLARGTLKLEVDS